MAPVGDALPDEDEQSHWDSKLGREITLVPGQFGSQYPDRDDFDIGLLKEWASQEP